MVGGVKLNLVSTDQMENEQIMVVVRLHQLQRSHGEARKDGSSPNYIRGVLARYKDVLTNELLKNLSSRNVK